MAHAGAASTFARLRGGIVRLTDRTTPLDERVHGVVAQLVGVRWYSGRDGIALTFDDGPHPTHTPALLDLLDRHGVRATFFVTGASAERHPDIVRRIELSGHSIGSHSMSHPFVKGRRFLDIVREYRNGRRAIERVLGRPVRLFRPPGSDLGYRSLMAMWLLGLRCYLCSTDPEDWLPGADAAVTAAMLHRMVAGDIALLHDNIELPVDDLALDRTATVDAVRSFLESRAAGIPLVTLG